YHASIRSRARYPFWLRIAAGKSPGLGQGRDHLWHSQEVQPSLHIIGKYRQAHFGPPVRQASEQEVPAVQGALHCAKGMLTELLSPLHYLWIILDSLGHLLQ